MQGLIEMNSAAILSSPYSRLRARHIAEERVLEPDPVAVSAGRLDQVGRRAPGCAGEPARGGDQRGHVGQGNHRSIALSDQLFYNRTRDFHFLCIVACQ